jgi:hypothetical protein
VTETTRQRLLAMAAERIGKEALAEKLKTPVHLVELWMVGMATMPDRKLMELANIIDQLGDDPT